MTGKITLKNITAEIEEDMVFQRRQWLFERIGRMLMGLVIAGSILGLFGNGLLSKISNNTGNIKVSFEKFARRNAPTSLTVSLPTKGELYFSESLLSDYTVESIQPQPDSTSVTYGFVHYTFSPDSMSENASAVFRLQPQKIGKITSYLGTDVKGGITIQQIVFP